MKSSSKHWQPPRQNAKYGSLVIRPLSPPRLVRSSGAHLYSGDGGPSLSPPKATRTHPHPKDTFTHSHSLCAHTHARTRTRTHIRSHREINNSRQTPLCVVYTAVVGQKKWIRAFVSSLKRPGWCFVVWVLFFFLFHFIF